MDKFNELLELKTPSAALASYDKAILINPDYAEAWSNRGNALIELGRPEDATKNYTRAIELQPVNAEAYSNRGTALLELGECDKAIADFDIALTLHPNDPEVCWNKALGLLLAGDNDNGQFAEGWNLTKIGGERKAVKHAIPWHLSGTVIPTSTRYWFCPSRASATRFFTQGYFLKWRPLQTKSSLASIRG